MTRLRDKLREDMELRGMSPRTMRAYTGYVRQFCGHFGRPPAKLGADDVREFMLHLRRVRNVKASTFNVCGAALAFFFTVTLGRPDVVQALPRMRVPMRLPTILSTGEVDRLLHALRTPKHRAMFMLAFGAGLRVSEVVHLRVEDIDPKRMVVRVRNAKRGRERDVMLSPRLLAELRKYWKVARPPGPFLFPGKGPNPKDTLTEPAFRGVLANAARRAGLLKKASPHVLRHTFATHMIEANTDLRTVQILLGHASLRSTLTYVHVTTARVQSLRSPLDMLSTPESEPRM